MAKEMSEGINKKKIITQMYESEETGLKEKKKQYFKNYGPAE